MSWEYLKLFHIIFVLVFFAGTIVSMMAGMRAEKAAALETIVALTGLGKNAAKFLTIPSFILVGVFGVLTAREQGLSLTDTGWLNAAYSASVLGFLLGVLVMYRSEAKAHALAARDLAAGKKSEELEKALRSPVPKIVGPLLHGLVLYILVLMVFKPFD
ncbi:MAG: DUF2269 family protein [Chloroflexi bacterium]|nr:DUF2269 family protein [Chloroflexota bacterium]